MHWARIVWQEKNQEDYQKVAICNYLLYISACNQFAQPLDLVCLDIATL